MNHFKRLWQTISFLGVAECNSPGLAKKVSLANQLGISLALLTMPYIFIFIYAGAMAFAVGLVFAVLIFTTVLLANKLRCYTFSRMLIVLNAAGVITLYSIVTGIDGGVQTFCIALFGFPMLLFISNERKLFIFSLLLPPTIYCFLYLKGFSFGPWVNFDPAILAVLRHGIVASTAMTTLVVLLYLYLQYESIEARLRANIDDLKNEMVARKKSQALNLMSESRLNTIFDSADDAIFVVDRSFRFVSLNKASAKYVGAVGGALGKTVYELMGPEQGKHFAAKYEKIFDTKQPLAFEERTDLPTGRVLYLATTLSPIFGSAGQVDQILGITRDVSEYRVTLQHLREAKEQAEAANLAKSQFLANMSHEIRTPMGIVLGFSDILSASTNLDPSQIKAIGYIQKNGQHLINLIDEILDLSKIEAGELKISPAAINLKEEIVKVITPLIELAKKKGIVVNLHSGENMPASIVTDSLRLRQIIFNVLGNAIKYSDRGEIVIETKMLSATDHRSRQMVQISVKDQGIGISLEDQRELFQPFSQGRRVSHENRGGTGLGLNLSRKLAQALGGDLQLKSSSPGVGSEFHILICAEFIEKEAALKNVEAARVSKDNFSSAELKGMKILVVEDNPANQFLIRSVLESCGAVVELAGDGAAGVARALAFKPNLVLMDLNLPILDGLEAASQLRKAGFKSPIVTLTANAMAGVREQCLAAGCDEYLTKPIDKLSLTQVISKLVR